jgi:CRP/FNR family transcriptional regulator, cyclic AMP receptor protein
MIAADYLKRIAAWSRELTGPEIEIARAGIVEKSYNANEFIFLRGDHFEYWTGVVSGLARMGIVSRGGKAASFAGLTAGAWFGEGTVLKNEARRYDVVALRDTRLAMMDRGTFLRLFENSVGFNRFLVGQLNERLGQFIALLEYGRTLDATARLARCIATLFNPILYPDLTLHLEITQEESAIRDLPAKCQPVSEKTGKGRPAAPRIWRRDHRRPRAVTQLWRIAQSVTIGLHFRIAPVPQRPDSNRLWG